METNVILGSEPRDLAIISEPLEVYVIGDSGHAREIAELYEEISGRRCCLVARHDEAQIPKGSPSVLGLGKPRLRRDAYMRLFKELDFRSIVHHNTSVSPSSFIGKGTVLMAGAVVSTDVHIAEGCLINWNATIGHDCSIGLGSVVNPNASVSGGVKVGEAVLIGAGAFIHEGSTIGDGCIVGAGSVVLGDVKAGTTVVGVPAHATPQK